MLPAFLPLPRHEQLFYIIQYIVCISMAAGMGELQVSLRQQTSARTTGIVAAAGCALSVPNPKPNAPNPTPDPTGGNGASECNVCGKVQPGASTILAF